MTAPITISRELAEKLLHNSDELLNSVNIGNRFAGSVAPDEHHDQCVEELRAILSAQPSEPVALIDKFAADNPEEWSMAVARTEALDNMYAAREALVKLGDESRSLERLDDAIHAMENPPCDDAQPSEPQGGEEVVVVACRVESEDSSVLCWKGDLPYLDKSSYDDVIDLMTVAQHRRILASQRDRERVAVEALEKARDIANNLMADEIFEICDEALAALEVKHGD